MTRRKRRRGSRRNSNRAKILWVGFCITSLLIVLFVAPSGLYNTAEAPRGGSVNVVNDSEAVIGLDKANEIEEGQVSDFVNVTNQFSDATLTITVELTGDTRDSAYLSVGGSNVGNSHQFTANPGDTEDINICVGDGLLGSSTNATFNATATASTTNIDADIQQRGVSVVDQQTELVNC